MRKISTSFVCLLVITGSFSALKADSIFNFDDLQLGALTPLTETSNGVTATFSAVDGGGNPVASAYDVETNPNGIGSGQRLIRTDASVATNVPLNLLISLSAPQQSVNFPFALLADATSGATLTLSAFLNGAPVGTASATSPTPFTFYSTGSIAFDAGAGNTFNSLLLDPSVLGMGIDDVSVSPNAPVSGVPEPASTALMLFGLAGMLAYLRRSRQKKTVLAVAAQ